MTQEYKGFTIPSYTDSADAVAMMQSLVDDIDTSLVTPLAAKADYPSGGTAGQALIKSGTTTAWGNAGGLVYITKADFAAAAGASINLCFSATYDWYRVLIRVTCSAGAGTYNVRMRASATDNSTANYAQQALFGAVGTASAGQATAQTSMRIGNAETAASWLAMDVFDPFAASPTLLTCLTGNIVTAPNAYLWMGGHNVSSAFDGFSFFPSAGTITGRIIVLGYQNA
jgi:hypothetical protein